MVEFIPLSSATIRAVAYDVGTARLTVLFTSGYTYRYFGVPLEIYQGLLVAASKGHYFNRLIRGRYMSLRAA